MAKIKLSFPLILICISFLSCETALEKVLIGKKVILLGPVNNLVTTDTLQTFYWENMDGALTYQLQIVSPRVDSIVRLIADTILTNRNRLTIDMNTGIYQWRVKAMNNSTASDYSDIWNLKIQ